MTLPLAYSSNGYGLTDLATAVRRIAAHGYTGVELLADSPHWRPGDCATAVCRALSDSGLVVSNINANTADAAWPTPPLKQLFEPALSNSDPRERQRRLDYTFAAMDLAAQTGARCLSVTSGLPDPGRVPAEGLRIFAESLSVLCEAAAERDLRLGVEYEPGLLVERADELLWLFDRVGHPALGANLDIGHAVCIGEDPVAVIDRLAGRIWNVHVEDIRGRVHEHLIPGDGDIDFGRVFDALEANGYDGYLTVELYTCSDRADYAARLARERLLALASEPALPAAR